jgi:hypothetical protein
VNVSFFLIFAELFLFAVMWHNQSARLQRECENEKPEPAVLPARRSSNFREPALTLEVQTAVECLGADCQ